MPHSASEGRAEQLLDRALELPPADRDEFLRRECATDAALRARIEKLLVSMEAGGGFLEGSPLRTPASSLPTEHADPSDPQVGSFRIVRRLGAGGMGEVFLADRIEGGFQQQVALKLLRPELCHSPERFNAERQILAELHHPGIAQLHDGGITRDGRPYMAMEYVEGEYLDTYCKARGATLEQRMDLFIQVCDAVTYAHEHLVVHRDLKPANILVTAAGKVKLLDFGIAKLLQVNATGDATRTAHLSPAYAAPEQLTGGAITTATDVYALGVTLFQLLCGRLPWQVSDLPLAAAVQRLLDEAAPSPSATVSTDAPVNARQLRGDLDAIVAKAMRKEPRDRYPDARALAADLERHRHHQPVTARAGARTYVFRRMLRRNWLPLSATAAVFAALAIGGAIAVWQGQRARVETARATAIKDFLVGVFKASDPRIASDTPRGSITAKELLDASATRIDTEFAADPEMQLELITIVAEIYMGYGDEERAAPLQRRRAELARTLHGEAHALYIDLLLRDSFRLISSGKLEEAALALERADLLIRKAKLENSEFRALWSLGRAAILSYQPDSSVERLKAMDEGIALLARTAPDATQLPVALANRATMYQRAGEYARAKDHTERAIAAQERSKQKDDYQLALLLGNLGKSRASLGELDAAESDFARAVGILQRTGAVGDGWYWRIAASHARLLHQRGDRDGASRMFLPILASIPPDWSEYSDDAFAYHAYGDSLSSEGQPQLALEWLERAERVYRDRPGLDVDLPRVWVSLAESYSATGRFEEARERFQAALKAYAAIDGSDPQLQITARERWGRFLLGQGDIVGAEAQFREVLAQDHGRGLVNTALAQGGLARVALARKDAAAAVEASRLATDLLDSSHGLRDVRMGPYLWLIQADALRLSGDEVASREWAGKALAASRRYDDPASPSIVAATAALAAAAP